jgi:hypothetical protein
MCTTRAYLLAGYIISLGILALVGWLYIGQTDDAPGAGMVGFAALLSSLAVGYRITRSKQFYR